MPFVHWAPKNDVRRLMIAACVGLGIHGRWEGAASFRGKTQMYFEYSVGRTFYRTCRELRAVFEQHGFHVDYVSSDHPRVIQHPVLGRCIQVPLLRKWIDWMLLNFYVVQMRIEKLDVAKARRDALTPR